MSEQRQKVYNLIIYCLDLGYRKKSEIYDFVEQETKLPRPTIRRIARELKQKLDYYSAILSIEIKKTETKVSIK